MESKVKNAMKIFKIQNMQCENTKRERKKKRNNDKRNYIL